MPSYQITFMVPVIVTVDTDAREVSEVHIHDRVLCTHRRRVAGRPHRHPRWRGLRVALLGMGLVMAMSDVLTATVDGVTHEIPEAWLVGFCRPRDDGGRRLTASDAVRYWHWQWTLEQRHADLLS